MGRKGVSKRKPAQTKAKPFSKDNAGIGESSVGRITGSQPASDKDSVAAARGGAKQSSDSKKPSKKR